MESNERIVPVYESDDKTKIGSVTVPWPPLPFEIEFQGRKFELVGGTNKARGYRYRAPR